MLLGGIRQFYHMAYAKRRLTHMTRHSKAVRWGHLAEIDRRLRVGSQSWDAMPLRLKHLSAWRAAHIGHPHTHVRMYGTAGGVRPSSDLRLRGPVSKIRYLQLYGVLRK